MATETELKYRVPDAAALEGLLRDPEVAALCTGPGETLRMESLYYDSPSGALAARRWTLRERRENDRRAVTLKTPGTVENGLHTRGEWETEADDALAALPELMRLGAPPELAELAAEGPLTLLCGASFTRRTRPLRFADGSEAELCADLGALTGGGHETPLCEAELELKSGAPGAMLAFAAALARRHGFAPEARSKFARALRTAGR